MIADTVVGLSSVNCEISTRDIGPKRRIASMIWKRLIARINSGSAVFIAPAFCLTDVFLQEAELFSSPQGRVNRMPPLFWPLLVVRLDSPIKSRQI